jgi:hypothetical protein
MLFRRINIRNARFGKFLPEAMPDRQRQPSRTLRGFQLISILNAILIELNGIQIDK